MDLALSRIRYTHCSKDDDSKLLKLQDLYLRFAWVITSHPSFVVLLPTVGLQSRFGTANTCYAQFFWRFYLYSTCTSCCGCCTLVRKHGVFLGCQEEVWWRPQFSSLGFSAAFSLLNFILTWRENYIFNRNRVIKWVRGWGHCEQKEGKMYKTRHKRKGEGTERNEKRMTLEIFFTADLKLDWNVQCLPTCTLMFPFLLIPFLSPAYMYLGNVKEVFVVLRLVPINL